MRALIDMRPFRIPVRFSVIPPEPPWMGPKRSPQWTYWGLLRKGIDPPTALRLTARLFDMPRRPEDSEPWTLRQIEQLVFLRAERARWPG